MRDFVDKEEFRAAVDKSVAKELRSVTFGIGELTWIRLAISTSLVVDPTSRRRVETWSFIPIAVPQGARQPIA